MPRATKCDALPPNSSADIVLKQLVRYESNQWDSESRFSNRAAAIMTIGGTILVGSVTLLSGGSGYAVGIRVTGWFLTAASIILAGWTLSTSGWTMPPDLKDATLLAAFAAKPEAVKQGLVLDYAQACRSNNTRLRSIRFRQDLALGVLTAGTFLIGVAFFAVNGGL